MIKPTLYTFGTMSLGADVARMDDEVQLVRRAMDAGIWFHGSPTYNRGLSFMILRMAFDQDRANVPPMIVKIRDGSADLMRFEAEDTCRRLGFDGIEVAQLVSMDHSSDGLAYQLVNGGPIADELASLRNRGIIRNAVVFVNRDHSRAGLEAQASELVDGLTFYWNACQRECSDDVWAAIQEQDVLSLALRTLTGGPLNEKWKESQENVRGIWESAGCADEVEFALRLGASFPAIRTSIGGTRDLGHLERYLTVAETATPLPQDVLDEIGAMWRDS